MQGELEKLGQLVYDWDMQVIMKDGNLQTAVLVFCNIPYTKFGFCEEMGCNFASK